MIPVSNHYYDIDKSGEGQRTVFATLNKIKITLVLFP